MEKGYYSTTGAGATEYPNAKNAYGPQLLPYAQTKKKNHTPKCKS